MDTISEPRCGTQPDQHELWSRIPVEMRALPQWALAEPGPERHHKRPRTITGGDASSTDPSTWTDFDTACAAAAECGWQVGFMLHSDDPLCCIDLDVKDGTPPEDLARFESVIATMDSYTERSRSGRGWHIWVLGGIGPGRRRNGIEVYSQDRFIICTGQATHDRPVAARQQQLNNMVSQMGPPAPDIQLWGEPYPDYSLANDASLDQGQLGRLFRGDWEGRYESRSHADLALVKLLAPKTESPRECWETFLLSALGARDKAKRPDYAQSTIGAAVAHLANDAALRQHGQEVAEALLNSGDAQSERTGDGASLLSRLSVDWNTGDDAEVPDIVDGLVADEDVTLLGGHGGIGKSFLALQIACAVATGATILHRGARQCRVLYYSAEDGRKRLTRRLRKLIASVGYQEEVLRKNLRVLDASEVEPLYGETLQESGGKRAAFPKFLGARADFRNLQQMVEEFDAEFVIIDGASDTFDGNEIARREVRAFVKLLRQVHPKRPIGVLLNVHIDRASARGNSSNDDGYAGSAQWHNSCRRRLFLQQEIKREYDEDTKQSSMVAGDILLRVMKNQDGPPEPDMVVQRGMHGLWQSAADLTGITSVQKYEADHGPTILRLIAEYYARNKFMSTSLAPQASTGVYATLKSDPQFPVGLTRKRTNQVVRQLERDGLLIEETYKRGNRATGERWAVALGPNGAN
ncbi:AAA family ATPase [Allosphingosinicella vermicomposti]|uniref:AAA family ATPase n=1 Tax=Allosphingosinicella vermicomposti TaxID=614671 RepID=UPI000D0EE982|nr:AAA family ATPase [Allosphingosinicella vermicomposti]